MEKAKNLGQLYKNLFEGPLSPIHNKEFYVPLFEKQLQTITFRFMASFLPYEYIYITGQSGVGKTSALNFLCSDSRFIEKYDIIEIIANEDICSNYNDIDVITLLLQIGFKMIEVEPSLKSTFQHELEKIKGKAEGKYVEETIDDDKKLRSTSIGFNFKIGLPQILGLIGVNADLNANLKNDNETRKIVRHFFSFAKDDLRVLVNKMAHKYQEIKGKPLLMVFHDLERMTNYESAKSLFVENRQYFQQTEFRKIISLPPALIAENTFTENKELFALKVAPNPMILNNQDKSAMLEDEKIIENTYQSFKALILARIADDADLISEDAIRRTFELSGGVVRQFLRVLQIAAMNTDIAKQTKISLNAVESAGIDFTSNYLQPHAINGNDFDVMAFVDEHHTSNFDSNLMNNFGNLVLSNKIFAYKNAVNWFSINPLLRRQFEFMKLAKQKIAEKNEK